MHACILMHHVRFILEPRLENKQHESCNLHFHITSSAQSVKPDHGKMFMIRGCKKENFLNKNK